MIEKIRKYLLPNVPYLMAMWFCLKLGTAYRLAEGANIGLKLMDIGNALTLALQDFAPGLNGFDWIVGITGAALLRLVIYNKVKKAKKFRRDVEYGSARWGTAKDIKPFIDTVFKNNVILTGTESLTMNTRPANPANARPSWTYSGKRLNVQSVSNQHGMSAIVIER